MLLHKIQLVITFDAINGMVVIFEHINKRLAVGCGGVADGGGGSSWGDRSKKRGGRRGLGVGESS